MFAILVSISVGMAVDSVGGVSGLMAIKPEQTMTMGWLNFLNTFMPSIGGVIIADYFILRKRNYLKMEQMLFTSVNKVAILAWLGGVVGAYVLPGIAPINSVLVSIVCYVGITKLTKVLKTEVGMQNSL